MKILPCYLLLLLLGSIAPLTAQESTTISVSGVISEGVSGESVIGAAVIVHRDSSRTSGGDIRGAISNKFGFYSIPGIAPGNYYITVRSIGYEAHRIPVTITAASSSQRIDLQLNQKKLKRNEIVVEADRIPEQKTTVSTVEVSTELIQRLPALGGEVDIFRALQLLPGVKSVSEISSGLYVRGGSPDQNLTLLDGVIVYNPSHLGGFLSTFNSDAVQDIRLIKGAFPAEYGGRISSVLDMTMREGTKEKISGTVGLSLINARATVEGPITEDATFMLSGRRMYLDAVLLALADPDSVPQYYFYDLNGKVNYRVSENDRIFLSGYFGRDVLNNAPVEPDLFEIDWGNATANLRWMHIASPQLFTNFSLIYSNYNFSTLFMQRDARSSNSASFKSISGIRDYMLRGELQWFPSEDHIIKAGTEVTEHRFRADASAEIDEFARIDRDPTILTSLDAAVYAQDEWQITPQLSSNLGLRLYYFEQGNYLRVEPRASLAFKATDDITIKGAFSLGNQFLHLITRNDISLPTDVWFPSTANIKPAEASQYVLAFEQLLFDREYLFTVEGYYKKMNNLLEYKDTATLSLDVPLESSFTRGNGESYGVELFLQKRLGALTGWLGYTLAWTRRTFPELNLGRTFYPRYDRRHDVSVVLTYQLGESWELGATWVYGTGQAYTMATGNFEYDALVQEDRYYLDTRSDYTERNGYRLPAFHKLDLNFTHSFKWFELPWQVSINIYNAYNHMNVFAQSLVTEYNETTGESETKIQQITLFPFIPTFGINVKF